jgi:hypothetical protein
MAAERMVLLLEEAAGLAHRIVERMVPLLDDTVRQPRQGTARAPGSDARTLC